MDRNETTTGLQAPAWPESRNRTSDARSLPISWSTDELEEVDGPVLFTARLGSETYGGPTAGAGRILVGTNNQHARQPERTGDHGVLMAFSSEDGRFLWQRLHEKSPDPEAHDWPEQGVCSAPTVSQELVHYLSNNGRVVALGLDGETRWIFDLTAELGVVPHFMSSSSPLRVGERLFVGTSNGPDEQGGVPSPGAPSLVALDASSGELLWQGGTGRSSLFEGQWSSPTLVRFEGERSDQIVYGGGDGVLEGFSLEGASLWKFDLNATLEDPPNDWERGAIIASPVWHAGLLLVASGRNPDAASGRGQLLALSMEQGVPQVAWRFRDSDLGFAVATVAIGDGRVYLADLNGFLFCLDSRDGEELWRYDTKAPIWASPLLTDGKVYVADTDGDVTVLRHAQELEVLAENSMGEPVFASPTTAGNILLIATRSRLYGLVEAR